MGQETSGYIGFACAYTPVPLINAAGYTPYRILPVGQMPDRAGQLLHDNLCPHVKLLLSRAMANDLPEFSGMVFINSCDAMRRLADAWKVVRPDDRIALIELPSTNNSTSVSFLAQQFSGLTQLLSQWSQKEVDKEKIFKSVRLYNELAGYMSDLRKKTGKRLLEGGSARLQTVYNLACTQPAEKTIEQVKQILDEKDRPLKEQDRVPVYLFGNVLPDPEIFNMLESCGIQVLDDDLCTGSRFINPITVDDSKDPFLMLAQNAYDSPPCARTFDTSSPMGIAESILSRAKACKARGVIGYTLKFCDPYLARLPVVREVLEEASLPLLLLEGDCSRGAVGQQQTRLEAFAEMLR